jgi:hypothetical protein
MLEISSVTRRGDRSRKTAVATEYLLKRNGLMFVALTSLLPVPEAQQNIPWVPKRMALAAVGSGLAEHAERGLGCHIADPLLAETRVVNSA